MKTNAICFDNKIITGERDIEITLKKLISLKIFTRGSYIYFSGYKWRSDPHCGVAINLFYRECVSEKGQLPFLLFYPRVSITSDAVEGILGDIEEESKSLLGLFKRRYGPAEAPIKYRSVMDSDSLYSQWVKSTKQGRIFLKYCSLIFCNDGIIVGNSLTKLL